LGDEKLGQPLLGMSRDLARGAPKGKETIGRNIFGRRSRLENPEVAGQGKGERRLELVESVGVKRIKRD